MTEADGLFGGPLLGTTAATGATDLNQATSQQVGRAHRREVVQAQALALGVDFSRRHVAAIDVTTGRQVCFATGQQLAEADGLSCRPGLLSAAAAGTVYLNQATGGHGGAASSV